VKQTAPVAEPVGYGFTIGFSAGTFIDPARAKTMIALHRPFYSWQANPGRSVTMFRDQALALRFDRDISALKRKFEIFGAKRRLTLAFQYGTDGGIHRPFTMTNPCPSGSDVQGGTCIQDSPGSTQVKAYVGYTYQLGIPGDTFGEGIGVSFGTAYSHWGGNGPAGNMDALGVEIRLHSALLWKMVGGGEKRDASFWATYEPPKASTPLPPPDPVKIPSNDRTKNPTCTGPNCF